MSILCGAAVTAEKGQSSPNTVQVVLTSLMLPLLAFEAVLVFLLCVLEVFGGDPFILPLASLFWPASCGDFVACINGDVSLSSSSRRSRSIRASGVESGVMFSLEDCLLVRCG